MKIKIKKKGDEYMNLPNKLTCLRMILIPFFLFFMIFPNICGFVLSRLISAALFGVTAYTDFLDGRIARKYNLITDFGKFMDPLADKLMVFGAMIGIIVMTYETGVSNVKSLLGEISSQNSYIFAKIFAFAAFIIIFRELAVTSMRLVVSNSEGIVVAANIFGKMKTVSQIIGVVIILLEPIVWDKYIASYVCTVIMIMTTLYSGYNYFKAYWPHINSNK